MTSKSTHFNSCKNFSDQYSPNQYLPAQVVKYKIKAIEEDNIAYEETLEYSKLIIDKIKDIINNGKINSFENFNDIIFEPSALNIKKNNKTEIETVKDFNIELSFISHSSYLQFLHYTLNKHIEDYNGESHALNALSSSYTLNISKETNPLSNSLHEIHNVVSTDSHNQPLLAYYNEDIFVSYNLYGNGLFKRLGDIK